MPLKHVEVGFIFVVILFSVVHNLKHDTQQSNQDTNFSEMKKNISFVNHLLKDLLQKYAQLKQIAKTDKNTTDPKLDTTAVEFFKGDSNIRVKAKVKLAKPRKFVGTTLFVSDESLERSDSERNKNKEQRAKESNDENDSLSPDSVDSREVTSITKLFKGLSHNQKDLGDKIKNKKETVKVDFSSDKDIKGNQKENKDLKDTEKVLVIHLGGTEKIKVKKSRASSPKPVFIQSNKKKQTAKSILFKSETTGHNDSDLEEEKALQEEILKIKQLRQAYGKACSQVVSRKCQKAIKAVLKDVCKSGRKCSGDFNDDFLSNGNAACNKEFEHGIKKRGRDADYQNSGNDDYVDMHQQNPELTGAQFIDYTREGDLDMTCLQALSNVKELNVARAKSESKDAKTQEVLHLRDRYEKACKQASYEKCVQACKSTSDKTCKKYDCITEKTKALKQSCKRRCKASNGYQGGSSSNSSSNSSASSGSSSGNSS